MSRKVPLERPSELAARIIVEKIYRTSLELNDFNGEADYIFTTDDGASVLEVTSYWMRDYFEASLEENQNDLFFTTPYLNQNWMIAFDGYPTQKHVKDHLLMHIRELEHHHIFTFDWTFNEWWMRNVPTLEKSLNALKEFKVISARVVSRDIYLDLDQSERLVWLMPSMSYSYGGTNGALEVIELIVKANLRDQQKLCENSAPNKHYWIWINEHTHPSILEAFKGESFRHLPERNPRFPEAVTHFWIVQQDANTGWHFNPQSGWATVEN